MISGDEWPPAFERLPSAEDPYALEGEWFRLALGPIALGQSAATFSGSFRRIASPRPVRAPPMEVSMRGLRLTSLGLVLLILARKTREEAPVTAQREGSLADVSESSMS